MHSAGSFAAGARYVSRPRSGTHEGHTCQVGVWGWPGDLVNVIGMASGLVVGRSSWSPSHAVVWEVSSWSARSL